MRNPQWTSKPLEDVATVIRGITFASGDKVPEGTPGAVPCLRTSNVQETLDTADLLWVNEAFVKRSDQWLAAGDTVISMANSYQLVGKVAYNSGQKQRMSFGGFIAAIRPCGINDKYLYFALRSPEVQSAIRSGASQTVNISNISAGSLKKVSVPVAPPSEQHRIVAAIETHFSRLDAAVASLTRAKANVKRARASVLKAAVEGRLVPTEAALARAEGRNYEPAAVLLKRILAERKVAWVSSRGRGKYKEPVKPETDGLPGLPEGWCWTTMSALLHGIEAGKSFAADNTVPSADQVGIVKVSAVTWGTYNEDEAKTVHNPALINPDYFVRRGDLLISRANTIELVGAAVIAERVSRRTMLSDKILRLNMPVPYRRYALWVLRSQHGRQQIEALATGNQDSMRNIGQDRIEQIAFPLPPLAEQHRIVAEVDRRLSVLDALDATLNATLARCARLRQAVLKCAFEGHLVPPETGTPLHAADIQMPRFAKEALP